MFTEILKEALASLNRNRTRALLTLMGMAWGVACFVILFAWGDGFARALDLGMAYFGDNVTIIWNGQTSLQAGGQKAGRRVRMELRDVEDVRKNAPLIRKVSPEFYRQFPMQSGRRLTTDGVRGVNHLYGSMRGQFLAEGRLLSVEDVEFSRRVVVLGQGLRQKLFSEAPALGEEVRIGGVPFTVIGVLRKKVSMSNYFGLDDKNAFVPYTAMGSLSQIRYLSVMVVQPVNPILEEQALRQVREILAKNHRFDPADERALIMNTWREMNQIMSGITVGMKVFLVLMGALTLSIGGVGLMNVMLVAVTERTREIGMRKALGARRRHILVQFLLEALMIAVLGGGVGYFLAEIIASAIGVIPFWSTVMGDPTRQADIHLLISPAAFLTASVTLGLVGLFSGLVPALRASRLAPVEALRYE
ncbi:MAG: ABC transporter permease [Acidobacteriota bacterium]